MKKYIAILAILVVGVVIGAIWQGTEKSIQAAPNAVKAKATHTSTLDLKWAKTPFGPDASPVYGDFSKGEHISYIKFAAGMKTPVHTHSSDYVGIVISGNTRHWIPGKPKTKKLLPVGSHWSIPANKKHISECLPGVECIMAIIQKGKFDFIPKK